MTSPLPEQPRPGSWLETPGATVSPPHDAAVTVGDYTLLARIGEGGMGVVHLARRDAGERVALKVLRPHIVGDDEARRRLAREVGSLSRVRSRWVAEIVDADPWAVIPYVATRYVPGLSLHDEVAEEGPIRGRDLIWFATCLAEGVAAVHAVGVLHRDVKPSNVLMEGRTPILIDFGLARVADDPKLTHTGWLLGTPGYLAPEILYGDDATTASDVHSWAATVAFAATGRPPFGRGPSMAVMDRVRRGEHDLSEVPQARSDGRPGLRSLLTAALDPEPERRPTLEAILAWLRPQVEPARHGVRAAPLLPPLQPTQPPTRPLALVQPSFRDEQTPVRPSPIGLAPAQSAPPFATGAAATRVTPVTPDVTRVQPEPWAQPGSDPDGWHEPLEAEPTSYAERARRAVLLVCGVVLVGAAVAAYPWPTLASLLVLVWLVRGGSLAASAAQERRRVRGRRWYDGPQVTLAGPWHLVRSIPGTVLLALWAVGFAVAGGLVCFALAATLPVTLAVGGAVLALSLWAGPGGSRVRSPLSRVVNPLCASPESWLISAAVVLAVAGLLGYLILGSGVSWTPFGGAPDLSGRQLSDLLPLR